MTSTMRAMVLSAALLSGAALGGCQSTVSAAASAGEDADTPVAENEAEFVVEVSAPGPDSPRGKALAAMRHADAFTLYSLEPYMPPPYPDDAPAYGSPEYAAFMEKEAALREKERELFCRKTGCVADNEILGSTVVKRAEDAEVVRAALQGSLASVPNFATACAPAYRHAIGFRAEGVHYQILLCYECGKVDVVADGVVLGYTDQAVDMGDEAALNAILVRAGIALPEQASQS